MPNNQPSRAYWKWTCKSGDCKVSCWWSVTDHLNGCPQCDCDIEMIPIAELSDRDVAALQLYALGWEYIEAYNAETEADHYEEHGAEETNDLYILDKFPTLVRALFPDLHDLRITDLALRCFGASDGYLSPGTGYGIEHITEIMDQMRIT